MVSEIPQFLYCQFRRTVAGMDDELSLSCVTSKAEITWLVNVGEFIWISYVPGESFKNMLRQCSRIEGSFLSDWPGVMVKECGLRLLYQHDLVEFEQNLKQCNALISEYSDFARQFMVDQEKSNKRQNPDDEAARPSMVPYNCIDDFHRHFFYNSCFPPSGGIILDWFSHPSVGPKVGIPLPPNFYNDPTWTGLALFASFSVLFGSPHSQVHCRFSFVSQNGTFGLGRPHSFCLHEDDLWLLNLDGFIWLVYLPREWFPKWLNRCSSIEAEISNCPAGLTVHKCGLHLLYQNDEEFFKEILFKTHLYSKYENEANKFDGCLVYNSCFPPNEILERFSHRSDEPQLTISLPPNLYDDPSWIGLALCVSFSLQKDGTTIVDNRDSQVPCNLICLLETDIGSLDSPHVYSLTKENLELLRLGGFIWLSHIPRGSFPNWLNQSSFIEASITTDFPSLTVHKCGFRLLYQNEEIEFKETIRHYTASLSTTWNVNHQYSTIANEKMVKSNQEDKAAESSTTSISDEDSHLYPRLKDNSKNDHPHIKNQDFDRCLVYNSCFPPNDILDWFSHQSDEPQLTISLPSNLYNDSTWMGLAFCVSFSLQDDGTTIVDNLDSQLLPCNLICYLETNIGSLEPLHKHCLTKDHHLKLLQLSGFIWLSFIPRVSFLNCLNQQSSFIEASVAIDCLGLTVQKCGFRLLYQNDEVEFKETIRRLSQTWDLIHQENTAKPNEEDKAAEPNTTSSSDDPKPKDKGKRIVE
ncbi:uncharacterized protein LOC132184959 [Corylus avellana]|uniref:uncharacterized protein LOC132184959 n=1 Tax=Corylus avellana TaxID=13451 RepID=UPI00286C6F4A|nr:uncharacterized protein LOC132184959 [Corylus avellana]XP_059454741.1 uncharacterized protein LOC132184959 [Corylus avellana]